jgi:D-tyrosyl-tRNA(Tyr) deacylase
MKAVLQRVSRARVTVEGRIAGEIGAGLVVLLGVHRDDTTEDLEWLCGKITRLRIFDDATGQMNLAVTEVGGGVLVVSQFTLLASTKKGNRPSWNDAARP